MTTGHMNTHTARANVWRWGSADAKVATGTGLGTEMVAEAPSSKRPPFPLAPHPLRRCPHPQQPAPAALTRAARAAGSPLACAQGELAGSAWELMPPAHSWGVQPLIKACWVQGNRHPSLCNFLTSCPALFHFPTRLLVFPGATTQQPTSA